MWDAATAMLRGKVVALNAYKPKMRKSLRVDNLNSQFRNVDKVRIRAEIDGIKTKRMIKKISETQNGS